MIPDLSLHFDRNSAFICFCSFSILFKVKLQIYTSTMSTPAFLRTHDSLCLFSLHFRLDSDVFVSHSMHSLASLLDAPSNNGKRIFCCLTKLKLLPHAIAVTLLPSSRHFFGYVIKYENEIRMNGMTEKYGNVDIAFIYHIHRHRKAFFSTCLT